MSGEKSVVQLLTDVMRALGPVAKTGHNSQQNYDFRGIDAVVNAVGPLLREHGVLIVPGLVESNYRDVQTSTGKPSRECTVTVTYRAYGPAGDFVDMQVPGESMDFGDKGTPKAMSVAFRILLLQTFAIPTGDPDPDSQSYDRAPAPAPTPVTDRTWLADFDARLTMAGTTDAIRALWPEAVAKRRAHQIDDPDWELLEMALKDRAAELSGDLP